MYPLKCNHASSVKANSQTHKRLLVKNSCNSGQLAGNRTEAKQQTFTERLSKRCECQLQQRFSVLCVCFFRYLHTSGSLGCVLYGTLSIQRTSLFKNSCRLHFTVVFSVSNPCGKCVVLGLGETCSGTEPGSFRC